jgi:ribonuclease E
MQDQETTTTSAQRRRRSASRPAGPPSTSGEPRAETASETALVESTDAPAARPRRARKTAAAMTPGKTPGKTPTRKKSASAKSKASGAESATSATDVTADAPAVTEPAPAADTASATAKPPAKRPRRARKTTASAAPAAPPAEGDAAAQSPTTAVETADIAAETTPGVASAPAVPLVFQAPEFTAAELRRRQAPAAAKPVQDDEDTESTDDETAEEDGGPRRRRRRGGRGRRKKVGTGSIADDDDGQLEDGDEAETGRAETEAESDDDAEGDGTGGTRRRRRRRRRKGDGEVEEIAPDDPPNTVVRVREPRPAPERDDEVTRVSGSTRLEAKKQRRREGREAGRRRPPVISEAEFLARREAVDRVMVVRQKGDRTQIGVLEDGVLVEHYVSRTSQQSMVGNVYLGRVQNVLPAMEAAFVDIGRGRNAILYAGEIDWAGLGKSDGPRRIEDVLKSGQPVLVQVTKDPIGHKGARLTGQVSLPGRYVVYVPGGSMSGISRKLPEPERARLKKILKEVVPEDAGVIVRTAAEGASEEELTHDVSRLRAQWEDIAKKTSGNAPALLYGEPDLAIKVVRDLFNEDFAKLVISGDDAWDAIEPYVSYVASSLRDRIERWTGTGDVFAAHRIDEQIAKALDRKVWLPSGGSLVIDRTEAMTVVDVNTGKFTGSGGNLEETVTKNNLEAAEEIVRQLRLRDVGGIIVIDFIDMVLEANRDLVLRRLIECLGRDRTKHQVAEVTSLGLVQMTRKRIGTDLLEAFSEPCEHCNGRGVHIHLEPVDGVPTAAADSDGDGSTRRGRRRKSDRAAEPVTPAVVAEHVAPLEPATASSADELVDAETPSVEVIPEEAEPAAAGPAAAAEPAATQPRRSRRRAQRPAGEPDASTPKAEEPVSTPV